MGKQPRNSDGTIRRSNQPQRLTIKSITARWVEAEALHLKRLGMSYQAIADHIVGVAHGKQQAVVPLPEQRRLSRSTTFLRRRFTKLFSAALFACPMAKRLSFVSSTTNDVKT